jgi:hypothetical protein
MFAKYSWIRPEDKSSPRARRRKASSRSISGPNCGTRGPRGTGNATVYFDSVTIVVLCASVATASIGADAFQECDTAGITRSIVKHNFSVSGPRATCGYLEKRRFPSCTRDVQGRYRQCRTIITRCSRVSRTFLGSVTLAMRDSRGSWASATTAFNRGSFVALAWRYFPQ